MNYQSGSPAIRNLERIVCDLEWAMKSLQIDRAKHIIEDLRQRIEGQPTALSRLHVYAPRVLISLAEATDFDESYLPLIKSLALFLEQSQKGLLSLLDLARIGIANGLIEFYEGRHDYARTKLESALYDIDRSGDADSQCTGRYYLARCYWREGDYKNSLKFLRQAKECDLQVEGSKRVAVIEILEGYLLFLNDEIQEGNQVLEHARAVLEETSDKINLAIVRGFQGQVCRRAGNYEGALEHFLAADEIYRSIAPSYRKRARCLMNMAMVLRLKALRIVKERSSSTSEVHNYLKTALNYLKEAEAIYNISPERFQKSLSKYHYICALLHTDLGELQEAWDEAKQAFSMGEKNDDKIIMAKAKIAQCIITLDQDSREAYRFALAAVEYAEQTQYRRVQARAYIWLAKTLLRPPLSDPTTADVYWHKADDKLAPEHKDYLREELESLRSEIDSFDGPDTVIYTLTRATWETLSLEEIIQELERAVVNNYAGKTQKEIAEALRTTPKRVRKILKSNKEKSD